MGSVAGERLGALTRADDPAWQAYRAWLNAARAAAGDRSGTWPELARELSRREVRRLGGRPDVAAELGRATARWVDRSTGTAVRNWHQRLELPKEPVLVQALVRVVSRLVPQAPPETGPWADFGDLVAHLGDQRHHGGPPRGRRRPVGTPDGWLRWGPGPASDLDPLALGLGSWAYDGGLPPYVGRGVDEGLRARLAAEAVGLTAVVGAPKAGKSRSVVEALRSACPGAVVWWVNAAPGVVPRLVDRVERVILGDGGNLDEEIAARGLVVVIDDAHLCGVRPVDGLSATSLARLARHARVVLTLHERDLAEWRRQVLDRSTPGYDRVPLSPDGRHEIDAVGATGGLVDLLEAHRIDLPSQLTDAEMTGVREALETSTAVTRPQGRVALPRHVERWAEYLAAVDQLSAKAIAGRAAGGYRRAVVEAALDASHVYVPTATADELRELARFHQRTIAPTRLWDERLYDEALDWALTPIGTTGSPHALVQADHVTQGYRLLDSLQSRLDPSDGWTPGHLIDCTDLSPAAMTRAGWAANDDSSLTWYERAAEAGNKWAVYNMGCVYEARGDLETAEVHYRKAADLDVASAINNLGSVLVERGELEEAETCFRRAMSREPLAFIGLGRLLADRGEVGEARRWFRRALHGHRTEQCRSLAHYELGKLDGFAGDAEAAQRHFDLTTPEDACLGMFHVAARLRDGGDLPAAITWFEHLWEKHGEDAYYDFVPNELGHLYLKSSKPQDALRWLMVARANRPTMRTWVLLAGTSIELGEFERADLCYRELHALGEVAVATCGLGHVRLAQGRSDEAKELLLAGLELDRQAAELDDEDRGLIAALLAEIHIGEGNIDAARRILTIAPLMPLGKVMSAQCLLDADDTVGALELTHEVLVDTQLPSQVRGVAALVAGMAHGARGDDEQALGFAEAVLADEQLPPPVRGGAALIVGMLRAEEGAFDDAERWFLLGAELGHPHAGEMLADLEAERTEAAASAD